MNPIESSLSQLLRNPALAAEKAGPQAQSGKARSSEGSGRLGSAETVEVPQFSEEARGLVADSNRRAALPAIEDFTAAVDLNRVMIADIRSGFLGAQTLHRSPSPSRVAGLIQ